LQTVASQPCFFVLHSMARVGGSARSWASWLWLAVVLWPGAEGETAGSYARHTDDPVIVPHPEKLFNGPSFGQHDEHDAGQALQETVAELKSRVAALEAWMAAMSGQLDECKARLTATETWRTSGHTLHGGPNCQPARSQPGCPKGSSVSSRREAEDQAVEILHALDVRALQEGAADPRARSMGDTHVSH